MTCCAVAGAFAGETGAGAGPWGALAATAGAAGGGGGGGALAAAGAEPTSVSRDAAGLFKRNRPERLAMFIDPLDIKPGNIDMRPPSELDGEEAAEPPPPDELDVVEVADLAAVV